MKDLEKKDGERERERGREGGTVKEDEENALSIVKIKRNKTN
jgi:hypothetical protein